ncbi:Beta-glucanase, GH16 family [Streptomyces yunnanensis]|uniref:Beta-glucanase, GH16 family n=2 Tax=Streptomyces yunnanensis TaxID=156453 RepID=A0A9X8R0L8_9ACTN|nr:Beta-glucanase, GH16 family [Streptomyces yunnanensis]
MAYQAHAEQVPPMIDPATPVGVTPVGAPALGGAFSQELVWSDEFNGSELDTAKWSPREQERGSHSGITWWYRAANVRLDGRGALAIDLRKNGPNEYSGGRIDSQGKFDYTYGSIEARVHTPFQTNGHLAAFWLQSPNVNNVDGSARDGAEIDIVETFYQNDTYPATIHYDGYGADHKQDSANVSAPYLHKIWYHTYRLDWTPEVLRFFYDGKEVRTIEEPNLISQVKEFPILSHEILAGAEGSIADAPLNDVNSTVYVDYIRVWQPVGCRPAPADPNQPGSGSTYRAEVDE